MARKIIKLTLHLSDIIYEIENKTGLTGDARNDGTNFAAVAHMKASDDQNVLDQLLGSIQKAYAQLLPYFGEYIINDGGTVQANVVSGYTPDVAYNSANNLLVVKLSMPCNYNNTTRETLVSAMYDYLVSTAVADWFNITAKTDAPEYYSQAGNCIPVIQYALSARLRPTRNQGSCDFDYNEGMVCSNCYVDMGDTASELVYYDSKGIELLRKLYDETNDTYTLTIDGKTYTCAKSGSEYTRLTDADVDTGELIAVIPSGTENITITIYV